MFKSKYDHVSVRDLKDAENIEQEQLAFLNQPEMYLKVVDSLGISLPSTRIY